MGEILIFAGTTEGRKLSEYLAEKKISHDICVATEYGEIVLKEHPLANVHQGRMAKEEIKSFLKKKNFAAVVDATHPFAEEITYNIKTALEELKISGISIPCLRLKRDCSTASFEAFQTSESYDITYFETNEACEKALERIEGNILLTTGSRDLGRYCISNEVKNRLYVRVLPGVESISLCEKQGIRGKQIIAMQGPFTVEMNEAIIRQFQISCLVTKESGATGGYPEKLQAAEKTGIRVFVIGCPKESGGYSFEEVCSRLEILCGYPFMSKKTDNKLEIPSGHPFMSQKMDNKLEIPSGYPFMSKRMDNKLEITLAGVGMGNDNCRTKEVEQAILNADVLLGSERMLKNCPPKAEMHPFYQAKQIIPYLKELQKKDWSEQGRKLVILFSGDSGFYSGCQSVYAALKKEIRANRIQASLRILPGISSVAYLASCIGESYQDASVCSMHGKKRDHLVNKIKHSPKTFFLTSGVSDVSWLGKALIEAGMANCEIITGYQLSYEEEKIEKHTPAECSRVKKEGLYTCFVKNPDAVKRKLTHGTPDADFIRDKVPMTKEEVREVGICKLRLREQAVVYDIGSGTGSIAVEIASLSDDIQVYAIEQKREGISLIEKNKKKFGLCNITAVEATAPEGLPDLPKATHAFIGGSSGRLKEILAALKQINPKMRIVINAVSMETICEIKEILSEYQVKKEEVVQLQVSRARKAGNYHLMQSENPVWICAFEFMEEISGRIG